MKLISSNAKYVLIASVLSMSVGFFACGGDDEDTDDDASSSIVYDDVDEAIASYCGSCHGSEALAAELGGGLGLYTEALVKTSAARMAIRMRLDVGEGSGPMPTSTSDEYTALESKSAVKANLLKYLDSL